MSAESWETLHFIPSAGGPVMERAARHLSQEMATSAATIWLDNHPQGWVELRCLDIHAFSPITLRASDGH